jgi:hypothetical protein
MHAIWIFDSSGGAESRLDVDFRGSLVGLGATY